MLTRSTDSLLAVDCAENVFEEATVVEAVSAVAATGCSQSESTHGAAARYDLQYNLARGGLGKISVARDRVLQRDVAYKELLTKRLRDPGVTERFVREAQVTGQLEHPSIVPIYDLGQQPDGTPFYVMKLVRGRTYLQAIGDYHHLPASHSERRLRFHQLLRELIAVCQAVAFAHEQGVLHRDLKPQNIMLGDFGETLVLDWGLAKFLGSAEPASPLARNSDPSAVIPPPRDVHQRLASETEAGVVLGTLAYMSPEQARGDLAELDARSDVYSLGAILFQVLTNRPLFERGRYSQLLSSVIEGRMTPPREIAPQTPRALDAICWKCLAQDKSQRYSSAKHLAADLECYLADEPVAVYREPLVTQGRRWCRRHRAAVTGAVAAVLVALCGVGIWSAVELQQMQRVANQVRELWISAETSTERADFGAARESLVEAVTQSRMRGDLPELTANADGRLLMLDRLLRSLAEDKAKAARQARDERQDNAATSELLGEALTLANVSPNLDDLQQTLRAELAQTHQAQAKTTERVEQQTRFATFQKQADAARFFGCQFTADDSHQHAAEAIHWAQSALRIYGLDQTEHTLVWPPQLSAAQIAEVRQRAVELCVILAEAEQVAVMNQNDAVCQAAAHRALNWLNLSKSHQFPRSRAAALLQAELLERLGHKSETAQALAEAEALEPTQAWEFFQLAEIERRNHGRFRLAAKLYQSALDRDPHDFLAAYFLGVAALQEFRATSQHVGENDGLLAAAQTAFTLCVAQRPDFPWPRLLRAVTQAYRGDFDAAETDMAAAANCLHDPQAAYDVDLFRFAIALNRGSIRMMQRRFPEAEADYRRAIELRPDSAEAHGNLAEALSLQQRASDALTSWNRALEISPQHATFYRRRGETLIRLGQPEAAEQDFLKVTKFANGVNLAAD